jgi:hypothetical protein
MTYAVVWRSNGGAPDVGRLDLTCGLLRLTGRPGYELAYDEIAVVRIERQSASRLAGRPTLVVETRTGEILHIASLEGPGSLHELEERLQGIRAR